MKRYVLGIAVLALGGCVSAGSSHHSVASIGGVGGDEGAVRESHGNASARALAASESGGHDTVASARGERGIPTPEPARDPAAREMAPTPQPPFPAGRGDPARASQSRW